MDESTQDKLPDLLSDDQWDGEGFLIQYQEAKEREQFVQALQSHYSGISIHQPQSRSILDVSPSGEGPHVIELDYFNDVLNVDEKRSYQLKSLIETHRLLLLSPEWYSLCLTHPSRPRWITRVKRVNLSSTRSLENTLRGLRGDASILDRDARRAAFYHLTEQPFRKAIKSAYPNAQQQLTRLIDDYHLESVPTEQRGLLKQSNDRIYSTLATRNLQERQAFQAAAFREQYPSPLVIEGEINRDSPFIRAFINAAQQSPSPEMSLSEWTSIKTLTGILYGSEDHHSRLNSIGHGQTQQSTDWLVDDISSTTGGNLLTKRAEFIASLLRNHIHIRGTKLEDWYAALSALFGLATATDSPSWASISTMLESYSRIEETEFKKPVSKYLAYCYQDDALDIDSAVVRIADFLQGNGPKVVIVVDSLDLVSDASRRMVQSHGATNRRFALAPVFSITSFFVHALANTVSLDELSGLGNHREDKLERQSLTDLITDTDAAESLQTRLNRGESILIYDSKLDVEMRYEQNRSVEVDQYVSVINSFITQYKAHADILVTSDHGMVETRPEKALGTPRNVETHGYSKQYRTRFTKDQETIEAEDDSESIDITLPETGERTTMLSPTNPHARYGEQSENIWTHGGISLEESLVPCFQVGGRK